MSTSVSHKALRTWIDTEFADLPAPRRKDVWAGLKTQLDSTRTLLTEELIFGTKRRERRAWLLVTFSLFLASAGVGIGFLGLSQSETQAYLTIVDKDTGIAQRAVTIERAVLDQSDAVVQSLVHGYVVDRETFNSNDNEPRILDVFARSKGRASTSLRQLWDIKDPKFRASAHPPNVYGKDARVSVDILNVTQITDNTLQVRFTKTLRATGEATREGKFVAVVTYVFKPDTRNNLKLVWENPFGFYVTGYRVTAEALSDAE
jgi:type IV secretion system protein VirB8